MEDPLISTSSSRLMPLKITEYEEQKVNIGFQKMNEPNNFQSQTIAKKGNNSSAR